MTYSIIPILSLMKSADAKREEPRHVSDNEEINANWLILQKTPNLKVDDVYDIQSITTSNIYAVSRIKKHRVVFRNQMYKDEAGVRYVSKVRQPSDEKFDPHIDCVFVAIDEIEKRGVTINPSGGFPVVIIKDVE